MISKPDPPLMGWQDGMNRATSITSHPRMNLPFTSFASSHGPGVMGTGHLDHFASSRGHDWLLMYIMHGSKPSSLELILVRLCRISRIRWMPTAMRRFRSMVCSALSYRPSGT